MVAAQEEQTTVIVNSGEWTEVYSGILYANLNGYSSHFLTSPRHATIIPFAIPPDTPRIEVITSRSNPYASGYTALLESDGYDTVEEIRPANPNTELAEELDVTKFIVIDDSYGYNAISVAPYAALGRYWVLFADSTTIGQVENFLEDRTIDELIVYGQVDREVKEGLEPFNPEYISYGDRFQNNIEINKRYQELHRELKGQPRRQAILSNGEFIERSLMSGADPVLFIGFSNVPEQVRNYISDSDLEVGTLVGNELIGTATFIRRQTGLSVFVKFGQGSRTPTDTIAQVEDLDRFPIPRYGLNLDIATAILNTATNALEVTYQNEAPIATYFQAISILITDEETNYNIPDENGVVFIDGNDFKTVTYDLENADGETINLVGDNIEGQITTIYGESQNSLEQTLEANVSISRVNILDEADIEIVNVEFSELGQRFMVDIKNIGDVDVYVTAEVLELIVNGEILIFSADDIIKIEPGDSATLSIQTTLEQEDYPDNEEVKIRALYGERENALTKTKTATFPFILAASYIIYYIILIILIILFIVLIVTRKKCKSCGHKNIRGRKRCKKCNAEL